MPMPVSSSFTAINQSHYQLLTPRCSATDSARQNQARMRTSGSSKRRRNPAVAHYLGLGSSNEPIHFEKHASIPYRSPTLQPPTTRKRRRLDDTEAMIHGTNQDSKNLSVTPQEIVCNSIRTTKHRSKLAASEEPSTWDVSSANGTSEVKAHTKSGRLIEVPQDTSCQTAHSIFSRRSLTLSAGEPTQPASRTTTNESFTITPLSDFSTNDTDTHVRDQYDIIEAHGSDSVFDDTDFDDGLNDDDLIKLTSRMVDTSDSTKSSLSSFSSLSSNQSFARTTPKKGNCPGSPGDTLRHSKHNNRITPCRSQKFVSPFKPIVRSPFPALLRDRSPVIGLSSSMLLRTCFRIGEAINQAHQASKSGTHMMFELYARILESHRDNTAQHFTLCDLFHGKPPYVKAVYDAALWKSTQLFEYDSRRLLQQGRMCRCMGRMRRDGKEWVMTVLNIFEATWDDIKWVEDIVNS
ncbi:hypothetical protein GQ44DRAFT_715755 [Phaeosphaeriaceae sp. PMI808]|nr:hypothetical protein GQ44DRAFT_715755 [Phaeosphaeriaceae sp. PMI808]